MVVIETDNNKNNSTICGPWEGTFHLLTTFPVWIISIIIIDDYIKMVTIYKNYQYQVHIDWLDLSSWKAGGIIFLKEERWEEAELQKKQEFKNEN